MNEYIALWQQCLILIWPVVSPLPQLLGAAYSKESS